MGAAASEGDRSPRELNLLDNLERQAAVVDALRARAAAGGGDVARCLAWLGVGRQAGRYLTEIGGWPGGRLAKLEPDVAAHREALENAVAEATREVAVADEPTVQAARRRLGIRLAVVGKGGAGKTMISATLARTMARQGRRIVAADLDTNPGLALSLGIGLGDDDAGVPMAVEEHPGAAYGWRLASGVSPEEVVERYAVTGPDGVRFLSIGKISEPDKQAAKQTVVATRQVLLGFGEPDWDVLGDMEAGPTTPFERYQAFADRAILVVGPAWRSALTARRLLPILDDMPVTIVANGFRDEPDHPGLTPAVRIPWDPEVNAAERLGVSPIDYCPDAPAVKAVEQLASMFLPEEAKL
ncbi:MAG TPA: hypothetical protein VFJ85_11390 [Acidimicrobiales bacterium]|nr:hypothetical protein [Acidimicrobiales bacterium]